MEQLIMLTVFAIAAALCLQIFALSGNVSKNMEIRDKAVTVVQNAAESVKIAEGDLKKHAEFFGGTVAGGIWEISYDESWNITDSENAAFRATACITENYTAYLGTAEIRASDRDGKVLFELTAAWQEELP